MAKVYSKSISVTRGIPKPKTTTNTNLTRKTTTTSSTSSTGTTDIASVPSKNRVKKRGCGCGRKKR